MARKSGPRQLKREPSPAFWPIDRKRLTWSPRTHPGTHPRDNSMPIILVLREILGQARTTREAIHIISSGRVKVDGKVRRDHRFPVGLMDVLQIEGAAQAFRILPKPNVGLTATPVDAKEASFKLCKIIGKRNIPGGKIQLNLHDGRNMIIEAKDSRQKTAEEYRVGAAVQLGFPGQKILGQVPFKPGALGLVVDGRNQGLTGRIESIAAGTHARDESVRIQATGGSFDTPAAYVIPIGTNSALVGIGAQ